MIFKEFLWFIEAVDPAVRDAILSSKWPYAKEKIELAAKELDKEYEGKPSPSKKDAFKFIHQVLGHERLRRLPAAPENEKLKKYHDMMIKRQITVPEYKLAQKYIDNPALDEVMTALRKLIKDKVITFAFKTQPEIVYDKKIIRDFKSLNQILSNIHYIQNRQNQQQVTPDEQKDMEEYADPALLAVSNASDLVYHVPADPATGKKDIYVFKGDDPLKCRLMGKGQSWCIASSRSVHHYFDYRHGNGQTQYFIFDYNKPANDPARYVNPGVAPQEGDDFYDDVDEPYEEWVDKDNNPNEIKGYASVDEYKKYLKSMGVPLNIFTADPHTPFEKKLFDLVKTNNWQEAYTDPKMWNFYWQIADQLPDLGFKLLNDDQKFNFLRYKFRSLTENQQKYIFDFYRSNPKKFWEWADDIMYGQPAANFMETVKQFIPKTNNINGEAAFLQEWLDQTKNHVPLSFSIYLLKNLGEAGVQMTDKNIDKVKNIFAMPPYFAATGKMPDHFLDMLKDVSQSGLSLFFKHMFQDYNGNDNYIDIFGKIPEKYYQEAIGTHGPPLEIEYLAGVTDNPVWFKDMQSIQKLEKIFREKIASGNFARIYPKSIFNYMPHQTYKEFKHVLNDESLPEDVRDYIAAHLSKDALKSMAIGTTSIHGTEPDILKRRSEEMQKQTRYLLRMLEQKWDKLDMIDLSEILQSHNNKRDLLRFYKQKGVNLEDLFNNADQIKRFIQQVSSTASTWGDQAEALEELGPEIINWLPQRQLLDMITSKDYRGTAYIGSPSVRNTLASLIKITPEIANELLYNGLAYASDKTLEKIKKGPYYDIIRNLDSKAKSDFINYRLNHRMPIILFDKNDLHKIDGNDLLRILDNRDFDTSLIDDVNKERLKALLQFPMPKHIALSTPLMKLFPFLTEQEIKDMIPNLLKTHGPLAVSKPFFWSKSKLPKSLIDDLPEEIKKYMELKYH